MTTAYSWYSKLKKPSWAPPSWVFGPVWTVLYILIAVSFGDVFFLFFKQQITLITALPFILNLAFNFSFTYFQFGLKNNYLAMADILLVLCSLIWAMNAVFPYSPFIAYIQIPYLMWVSFATILQLTVTYLNR